MNEAIWIETNGARQFVSLRGRGAMPVLLIHGGPGASLLPSARQIARGTQLEADFALAYWEQRGTGRSRGELNESDLSLDTVLSDAVAVAEHLAERFGRAPLIVGHSWGTVVGVLLARDRPDLAAAYVGAAQVVNVRDQEAMSTAWARD
ncbi:alpha/beta fold hydrolase [Rubrivirga sp.]|uniref:alpha/beta fold hydrolase n=1 Tax=Rubrivirga sp. TaxID=1885344 RepID=UPI003B5279D5